MREFIAKITLAAILSLVTFSAFAAGKVTFEANSPLTVAVGEMFRVEFSVNAEHDKGSFERPSFEGFDLLAGPSFSQGWSVQAVNNSVTRIYNCTYTFVLLAREEGNFTIGPAEIKVDGETYRTDPLPIQVVKESEGGDGEARDGDAQAPRKGGQADAQTRIASDDILLRTIVSRTSVFKGEPLRVTFKLYERVPVVGYNDIKFPSFNGFWAQELDASDRGRRRETYNGKVYETQVAQEYLLYPQQTGTLTIDPAELTAVAQVIVRNRRNMDPFFGGGPEVYNVPRRVQTQKVAITVRDLPAGAPASFSGAVGRFSMEATESASQLAANSAATYTVKISGTGNLTFVQAPKLALPSSFEQYNVKTTESINATTDGISGYRQFEYPFIARADGTYEIDPVEFTYFDPGRIQYVTLRSEPLSLEILPDAKGGGEAVVMQGRGMSKETVRMLGQDIRFIKLGRAQLQPGNRPFVFGPVYWLLAAVILGLFAGAYLFLRKRIRESQNVALVRGKRANKVAVQRFRAAKRYMEEQNLHAFYEEMLRALWGYMGDKLNIPVSNLTKENVREELHKCGVSAEESQRFAAIITKCDEAQYSPAASAQMSDVYGEGVEFISRIESVIKR